MRIDDIKRILDTFEQQDRRFLLETDIFDLPVYREVIYRDSVPICFIEAKPYNKELYLNIGVIPSARRTGVARTAFKHLLGWFEATNYLAIRWNAHINNVASSCMALSLGFTEFKSPDPATRYFALGNNHTKQAPSI